MFVCMLKLFFELVFVMFILFVIVCYFFRVDYLFCWQVMKDFIEQCDVCIGDEFWVLEYFLVYILGQVGKLEYIFDFGDILVVYSDWGGQVIYYGFGQMVIYLLLDVCWLGLGVCVVVIVIEDSVVEYLCGQGLDVENWFGVFGVYVVGVKIVLLGLCICQCGSYYGLLFNCELDLVFWWCINFCGYVGQLVISLVVEGVMVFCQVLEQDLVIILLCWLGFVFWIVLLLDWYILFQWCWGLFLCCVLGLWVGCILVREMFL